MSEQIEVTTTEARQGRRGVGMLRVLAASMFLIAVAYLALILLAPKVDPQATGAQSPGQTVTQPPAGTPSAPGTPPPAP